MLNQVVILGNIKDITDNCNEKIIYIENKRTEKDENNEYKTDLLKINTKGNIKDSIESYCKIGDFIAIRGTIHSDDNNQMYITANKISFLSSKAGKESNGD